MGALGSEARCRRDNGVIKKAKDFQKKKVGEKSNRRRLCWREKDGNVVFVSCFLVHSPFFPSLKNARISAGTGGC